MEQTTSRPGTRRRWLHALLLPVAALALTPLLGLKHLPDWPAALAVTISLVCLPLLAGWGFLLRGAKGAWSIFLLLLVLVSAPTVYQGLTSGAERPGISVAPNALPAPPATRKEFVTRPPVAAINSTAEAQQSVLDTVLEQPESAGATAGADEPVAVESDQALQLLRGIMAEGIADNRRAMGELDREFGQIPLQEALQASNLTTPDGIERGRMAIRDLRMHVQRRITVSRELLTQMDGKVRAKVPQGAEWEPFWRSYRTTYARRSSKIDSIAMNQRELITSASSIIEFMGAKPGAAYADGGLLYFDDPAVESQYKLRVSRLQAVIDEQARLHREEVADAQAATQDFDDPGQDPRQ